MLFGTHSDPYTGLCLGELDSFAHKGPDISSRQQRDGLDSDDEGDLDEDVEKIGAGLSGQRECTLMAFWRNNAVTLANVPYPRLPDPYDPSQKPHPESSPLARFRQVPNLTATGETPSAQLLYQARCEVTEHATSSPITLQLNPGGSYQTDNDGFPKRRGLVLPLTGIALHCAIDEERKLIFAADGMRIKSFAWGDYSDRSDAGTVFKHPLPVHTLNSTAEPIKASGPIALTKGRLLRAGEGIIGVWNVDELDQHVPGSREIIGGRIDVNSSWRQLGSVIEPSAGNACHTSIALENKDFPVGTWHLHPSEAGVMLAGVKRGYDQDYATGLCHALDLESGVVAAKYIGHGAEVNSFSMSAAEPNTFMTCCEDGCIRLFDTRRPLPILTINESTYRSGTVSTALYIHPDGIPTIITGANRGEEIKLWDLRARAVVYEIATGNNAVIAMTWDSTHNALYATTACMAKIPQATPDGAAPTSTEDTGAIVEEDVDMDDEDDWEDVDDDDDDDDDEDKGSWKPAFDSALAAEAEDDYDGCGRRWPKRAEHSENYFGHTFDAGGHRLYRYTFKNEVRPDVLPGWGGLS
ncbi:hypothetical protein HYDPIDRAFT_26164 [Hydnomerulius pinastri MD-312]|nr:hypothetical protein HYDPIDRAFT_26164 [Hydnomerulius pinastri MD-312]